jgi:hypothetical protein
VWPAARELGGIEVGAYGALVIRTSADPSEGMSMTSTPPAGPPPPVEPPPPSYPPPSGGPPELFGEPAQSFGGPAQSFGEPAQPSGASPAFGRSPAFNAKTVDVKDWVILAAGVLAFIFSFPSYYIGKFTEKVSGTNCPVTRNIAESHGSASAWHGFFGWFAAVVALAAAALLALELFGVKVALHVPTRLVVLGGFALATLCVLLAFVIHPGIASGGFQEGTIGGCTIKASAHVGHGFGYFASLIVILAGTAVAFLRVKETGGELPWEKRG